MPANPLPPEPLPADVFDSHCHLNLLRDPVDQVVAAGRAVGIRRIVTVGYDLDSSRWAAACAADHADVYAAVAIHPNEAASATPAALADIAALAQAPEVRAVGETGLDFYRDWADPADQERSFRAHIEIAKAAGKALVIHDRDAHAEILQILADAGAPEQVVFHCFSGDTEMAKVCADRGYVMSFAGNLTFKNATDLRAAAAAAPVDLLLVETDAPYLTPVPHRGALNAPYLIPYTLRLLAEIKQVDLTELAIRISATGERVFGRW